MAAMPASEMVLTVTPGQALRALTDDFGLAPRDVLAILEATPKHLERWASGQSYPQTKTRQRLAALMALHRHLQTVFDNWEGARSWLTSPSRYLAGLTPVEVMRAGRVDRARDALVALDAGVYL